MYYRSADHWPPVKKNLIVLVVSLSILLLFVEMIFRVITPESSPGTTYGKLIKRNRDGFREKEFAIPKPPKTYRVLMLGDSFTWGVGLNVEETIPKLLEMHLSKEFARANIEVVNASNPGDNTVEQLLLLKDKGIKYDPDMIILIYNLNDIAFDPALTEATYDETKVVPVVQVDAGENITKFSERKRIRGVILWFERRSKFVQFLVPRVGHLLRRMGLLKSVEFSWVQKIFQGFQDENPGWIESKKALKEIANISRDKDAALIVAIYPLLVELDDYKGYEAHATICSYLKSIEVSVIDLLTVFENKNGPSYWINFLDGHPNAEAHRLATGALLPIVKNYIHSAIPRNF